MEENSDCHGPSRELPRILGRLRGERPGPTLVVMAGIHGNEPAGIVAAGQVLQWLGERRPQLCGELTFLAGNLPALRRNVRFIDLDLNRQWTSDRIAEACKSEARAGDPVELGQQRELLATLRGIIGSARGPLYFIDHHTSSADGPPFLTIGDTLRNRRFARSFPLPLILGLEEQVDGALLELLNNHGLVTMGVEAGRHDARESVAHHRAVMWLALVASGVLPEVQAPELASQRALLSQASRGVPPVVEVRHRHAIVEGQGFRMLPGHVSFRPIRKGDLLAHDQNGEIRAKQDGLILLPLYQQRGEEGFFIGREVRPFWLRVSALLRGLEIAGLMRFLPGVRLDPTNGEVLIVDTRVARLYPLEIFHLLGFRKLRRVGADLVVSRRRHDVEAPPRISFC